MPEGSPETSKDAPSAPDTLSADEWWAEMRERFRYRNSSPSERQSQAEFLRSVRAAVKGRPYKGEMLGFWPPLTVKTVDTLDSAASSSPTTCLVTKP
jgi:hypothetical protein